MSDIQCPVQIPSIDGELVQCVNFPMGNAVLCAEDARTLGVIRWAILNDDEVREIVYRTIDGDSIIDIDDAPILSEEAVAELAEKTAEALAKAASTEKKPAGKKGA